MMATVDSEQKPIRLAFESDVTDSDEARIELVRMVKKARKMMSN
jgi:putative heme iron utilization protein